MKIKNTLIWANSYIDYGVWLIGIGSMFGSLYFSEVMKLPPCLLCWWQRVMMYPIAFIMSVAILRKDNKGIYYALPLAVTGWIMALYHSLLQWQIIKEDVLDCSVNAAVSCTDVQINLLGFINIPFMSLMAFSGVIMLIAIRYYNLRVTDSKVN